MSAFSPPEGQNIPTQSSVEEGEMTFNRGNSVGVNKELLNIAVEIGDGKSANILIREYDDPYNVSYEFASRYGLNE